MLCESGDALGTEPGDLDQGDAFGESVRFAVVHDLFRRDARKRGSLRIR